MLSRGIDIRYVVTSLQGSDAEHIYETICCAHGGREPQLASDRTSCRSSSRARSSNRPGQIRFPVAHL